MKLDTIETYRQSSLRIKDPNFELHFDPPSQSNIHS